LSGRGLCDELITRPKESYRLCCVVVCDLETSRVGASYIYDISHLRVKWLSSYRKENTLRLGYEDRYFKVTQGKQSLFFLEKRKEHINCTVWAEGGII